MNENTASNYLPLQCTQLGLVLNGQPCLQEISFTLNDPGITAIMGANGSGKTLLLKACAGLLTPSHGTVNWQTTPKPPVLTLVPQQAVLLNRTVGDNLLIPLRYHRVHAAENRAKEALAWAGIGHLADQSALTLSTGEQQLLALARAWSLSPKLLLLDEPSANLDPTRQQLINPLIEALAQDCKILLSTHSIQQARELANDVILLNHGKLAIHAKAEDFFNSDQFKQLTNYA